MKDFRITIRARLTLVYGALFLVAALVMLAVTWALVQQQLMLAGPGEVQRAIDLPEDVAPGVEPVPQDFVVSVVGAARDEALQSLLTQGLIAVVLVGGLAIWIGWLLAGRMLQPLSTITATARRIADAPDAERRMHERIRLTGPRDEVTELADTFDGMLARLDASFDAQRRFVSNASHELRTPLTLNRALIELAASRPDASDDLKRLGDALLRVNERHERLIEALLLLARSERELPECTLVDLADVAAHVVDDMLGETIRASGVRLSSSLAEAPTSADPVLLEHLVRNLVENALRHNVPEDGWARVTTRTDADGRAVLEVANSGPMIAPYELDAIFEPFRRLATERLADAGGAGLGLSIVRAIVHAHGGSVAVQAQAEGGLAISVSLPGEAYDDPLEEGLDDDVSND